MHTYDITLYSGPACQQCKAVKRKLDREGIPYTELQAVEKQHHDYLRRVLGYQRIPVVVVRRDGAPWVHFAGNNVELLGDVINAIKGQEAAA